MVRGEWCTKVHMVRISDMAKETPSSSIDQQGTDSIEDEHILAQIQHMFFQHRMVLKQLDYQVMTCNPYYCE